MIIIIIILARGINHSHVRARTGQGAGGERGRGSRPYSGHEVVGMLDTPLSQCPSHVSVLNIHMSSVSPASIKGRPVVNPVSSQGSQTNWLNARWSMMALYLNYMPIKPAKYELTAANLTASRLSGRKHCLSGHPSLNCNERLWQVVLASQISVRFRDCPHKSFSRAHTGLDTPLKILTSVLIIFK